MKVAFQDLTLKPTQVVEWKQKLNALVYELYGLMKEANKIVEEVAN